MRATAAVVLALSVLIPTLSSAEPSLRPRRPQPRSYDTHSYYALELHYSASDDDALSHALALGVELVEPLGELAGHWLVRRPGATLPQDSAIPSLSKRSAADPVVERWHALRRKRSLPHSRSVQPLSIRQRAKRAAFPRRPLQPHEAVSLVQRDDAELLFAETELSLHDPMLNLQWHLINTEMPDYELNVTSTWGRGITGKGVKVALIDDGLDANSNDLKANFFADGSYDFNDHTELPLPRLADDRHGTRCAGEVAAVPNDVCGVGVAYDSKVAGVRILSAPISDADEAAALNYAYQLNDIYSCSWGPPDDGRSMEAPDGLILKALVNGVQNGRGGKGSIYVFAAGNGGGAEDQCNFDGYTNSIFSVTVGAYDRKGGHPYYSEMCSAMMVVAPSSGSGDQIHTTDVGENVCAHSHGGTSAAAPLAVGVIALALSARPDLGWRDVQHIAVRSAVHIRGDDQDWETTHTGRPYSYKFGFGKIDAGRFVEMAETWSLVKPQAWFDSPAVYLPITSAPSDSEKRQDGTANDGNDLPTDDAPANPAPEVEADGSFITPEGVVSTFEVTQEMLGDSNFEKLEHVTVRVWITHQRRGDVEVELVSPNGIQSVLARQRRFDDDATGYPGWKFMSLKHWEENPIGTWTITVRDRVNPEKTGKFIAWSLQLWGECVDAYLAKNWAPAEEGQPDEEETGSDPSATVSQKPKPTDHLPTDHGDATHDDDAGLSRPGETDEDLATGSDEVGSSYWDELTSLAGNRTWVAGAGGVVFLIVIGAGIGTFLFLRARRKRRNLFGMANNNEGARGAYAPVSDDMPMGLLERGRRKLGGAAKPRPGTKELYDAFGDGPSDSDSDLDGGDKAGLRGTGGKAGLQYHDDFLEDEGEEDDDRDERSGRREKGYRDEEDNEELEKRQRVKREGTGAGTGAAEGSGTGSSGSWQDAEEDVRAG